MGVRGVIVASLSGKDLRDFQASERRQRASLHGAPPFGVLALDGTVRRPIAGPIAALLKRLAGREVGLLTDPPALVFDADESVLPVVDPAWVRIRSGPMAGAEGRVSGPAVPHWFPTRRPARGRAGGHRWWHHADGGGRRPRAARLTARRSGASATLGSMSDPSIREQHVTTRDADETRALAARLAAVARAGDLVCLVGDLGAGKTQFAKGFAVGLGVTATVNSPTFVLMAEYPGRLPLFHVDLYRLEDAADALSGGLLDERQLEGVAIVEWAERLGPALPRARLDVIIDGSGDDPRRIALADCRRRLSPLPRGRRMTQGIDRSGPLLVVDTRDPTGGDRARRPGRDAARTSAAGWPATATARSCWVGSRRC